ncbi:Eco29kI family restriction endonuclease [Kitasatospora griseola]
MGDQSGRQQLSHALNDLLARSGMTKSQLASDGNLSRTTVHAAFSPDSPPPSDRTLEVIAEKLNADPVPLRNLLAIARREEAELPRRVADEIIRVRPQFQTLRKPPESPYLRQHKFDPLRPESLVHSVLQRFRAGTPYLLAEAARWAEDRGIYALYYTGAHDLYAPISGTEVPLYVGSVAQGLRGRRSMSTSTMNVRLEEHFRTLEQSRDLNPADFVVRLLFLDDLFIAPAAELLTVESQPLWNSTLEGFGLRHPGRQRLMHALRPKWHELHAAPDSWANEMRSHRSVDELREEVRRHFAAWLP